jgi:Mce-associated membrane protein
MSDTRSDSSVAALRQAEEAENEAAEAEAIAAAARARAQELRDRRAAATMAAEGSDEALVDDGVLDDGVLDDGVLDDDDLLDDDIDDDAEPRALAWKAGGIAAAVTALLALIAGSGYFVWQDREINKIHEQQSRYAAAAQQGVVNLMSLDFNNAQADIQRVVDGTTGEFHDDFASSTNDFLTVMQESQVVTTASVSATAVDSMTDDSAVVLVAATSQVANSVSKQPNPRIWRLSVTVNKVDDQIKMSKVEFVP